MLSFTSKISTQLPVISPSVSEDHLKAVSHANGLFSLPQSITAECVADTGSWPLNWLVAVSLMTGRHAQTG